MWLRFHELLPIRGTPLAWLRRLLPLAGYGVCLARYRLTVTDPTHDLTIWSA
jgi:hypothetical protein